MSLPAGTLPLTTVAMLAFAANSLLCRATLRYTDTEAIAFTAVRLVSAAATLWLLVPRRGGTRMEGSWSSAFALFVYAAAFSFSYVQLAAGVGALLLFGAVQLTMIGWGMLRGERLRAAQAAGLAQRRRGGDGPAFSAGGGSRRGSVAVRRDPDSPAACCRAGRSCGYLDVAAAGTLSVT